MMRIKDLLKTVRSYFLRGFIALLLLIAGLMLGPRLLLGPRVPAAEVTQRDFIQTVVATGHVETPHRISIGSQIVGSVRQVPVTEGQFVKAGQHLIELDDAEWRAAAQQADMLVLQARARLRQLREVQAPVATQTLLQAQINLDYAKKQWQRNVDLFKKAFISQSALDDAKKNWDLAEAQWQSAKKQVETTHTAGSDYQIAATALAQAEANAKIAYSHLRYAVIATPVDGTLIARDVETGDVVQPGKALMALSPSGTTQLLVQIDEKNLRLLSLGQLAIASADAYPEQKFSAVLNYINPGVDLQRGSVEVKLNVTEPPAYLRQDMTVSVDIQVAKRSQAILVPTDAIHELKSLRPWVLKIEAGKARRQMLKLGLQSAGMSEVLEGLHAGDLVLPSVSGVAEGERVRPVMEGTLP